MNILEQLEQGVTTSAAEETLALAENLAAFLPENHTLALQGELGAGKTTFVKGLAQAWGITEDITSPTFNIFTLYRGARNLLHLDAYRLENVRQIETLMVDEFLEPPFCLAVEWPENVSPWLPDNCWRLNLNIRADQSHHFCLHR